MVQSWWIESCHLRVSKEDWVEALCARWAAPPALLADELEWWPAARPSARSLSSEEACEPEGRAPSKPKGARQRIWPLSLIAAAAVGGGGGGGRVRLGKWGCLSLWRRPVCVCSGSGGGR